MTEAELRVSEQAKRIVSGVLRSGGTAVDATAGNGHDTLFLSQTAGDCGQVLAFDIQQEAVDSTRQRLADAGAPDNTRIQLKNNACFADEGVLPETVDVFMYNLGYLPGSGSRLATTAEDTLASLQGAAGHLAPGGVITICLYPHNPEEIETVEKWCARLTGSLSAFRIERMNRSRPPYLAVVVKEDA